MKVSEIKGHDECNAYCRGNIHCLEMNVHISNLATTTKEKVQLEVSELWGEPIRVVDFQPAREPAPLTEERMSGFDCPDGRFDKPEHYIPHLFWAELES